MDVLGLKRTKRRWTVLLMTLGWLLLPGCRTVETSKVKPIEPGPAPVHQAVTNWANQMIVTSDVVHQGAPLPGIVGRLYLVGPDQARFVKGDGKVIVDLYDVGQPGPDGKPKMLQRWEYDKSTLDRLFRKDWLGWGYTLFLPWPDYQPDVKRVQLRACYLPDKGTSVFAPHTQVSLRSDDVAPAIQERTVLAAQYASPARAGTPVNPAGPPLPGAVGSQNKIK